MRSLRELMILGLRRTRIELWNWLLIPKASFCAWVCSQSTQYATTANWSRRKVCNYHFLWLSDPPAPNPGINCYFRWIADSCNRQYPVRAGDTAVPIDIVSKLTQSCNPSSKKGKAESRVGHRIWFSSFGAICNNSPCEMVQAISVQFPLLVINRPTTGNPLKKSLFQVNSRYLDK